MDAIFSIIINAAQIAALAFVLLRTREDSMSIVERGKLLAAFVVNMHEKVDER